MTIFIQNFINISLQLFSHKPVPNSFNKADTKIQLIRLNSFWAAPKKLSPLEDAIYNLKMNLILEAHVFECEGLLHMRGAPASPTHLNILFT